jgi:hypothetical protein
MSMLRARVTKVAFWRLVVRGFCCWASILGHDVVGGGGLRAQPPPSGATIRIPGAAFHDRCCVAWEKNQATAK